MENYNDTDVDFWKDLDDPTPILPKVEKSLEEKISKFKSKNPSKKDQFSSLLNKAREAASQHYKDMLNVSLHKQEKYFEKKIALLQDAHREEIQDLLRKFWKLDETLINRDDQITSLQRLFAAQEIDLACTRIKVNSREKEESEDFREDLITRDVLDHQASVFRELVGVYENDIQKLKEQVKSLEGLIKEKEKKQEVELLEMKTRIERNQNDCKKKVRDLNQKYLNFRNDVGREFELKDLIIQRQGENIARLKEELNMAKTILDTPRLLFKYNSREPYRHQQSKSLNCKPLRNCAQSKSILKQRRFDSNETLGSTRATPIYTMTPEPEYSASVLPTLSESGSYKHY
jgi:ElaB/YqjD/DUF883 family membrane-anchored ribosome-binding protein